MTNDHSQGVTGTQITQEFRSYLKRDKFIKNTNFGLQKHYIQNQTKVGLKVG